MRKAIELFNTHQTSDRLASIIDWDRKANSLSTRTNGDVDTDDFAVQIEQRPPLFPGLMLADV